jgi:hypothetical protein
MNVRPTSTGPSQSDASALRRASQASEVTPEAAESNRPKAERTDQVELSDTARALSATRKSESTSELSPDRLKGIMARLARGFYDRPEVQDRILERLAADLENDPPGS